MKIWCFNRRDAMHGISTIKKEHELVKITTDNYPIIWIGDGSGRDKKPYETAQESEKTVIGHLITVNRF